MTTNGRAFATGDLFPLASLQRKDAPINAPVSSNNLPLNLSL